MKPRHSQASIGQDNLFQSRLDQQLNPKHPLFRLAQQIDWGHFEREFGSLYAESVGAPAIPTRLMVGLHYLKHAYNESDESVVEKWIENPYWQFFCGYEFFQHELPCHPTSLVKWRQRLKSGGVEQLLKAERREQRLARYEEVHRVSQAGLSKSAIAWQTGMQRETVRSFLRADVFPERVIPEGRPSTVEPFADYLRERWRAGCTSAKKLYQEIRARGFKGAPVTVRRYVSGWRKQTASAFRQLASLPDFSTPSPRQATWWLIGKAEKLEKQERDFVMELTSLAPTIQTAQTLALDFFEMMNGSSLLLIAGTNGSSKAASRN